MKLFLTSVLTATTFLILLTSCTSSDSMKNNPFAQSSTLPFEAPDFNRINVSHYMPAFTEGIKLQIAEIEAIATNPDLPDFENTITAMEQSGELLTRVQRVFF